MFIKLFDMVRSKKKTNITVGWQISVSDESNHNYPVCTQPKLAPLFRCRLPVDRITGVPGLCPVWDASDSLQEPAADASQLP